MATWHGSFSLFACVTKGCSFLPFLLPAQDKTSVLAASHLEWWKVMGIVCKGSAVLAGWWAATHYKVIQSHLQKQSTRLHYPRCIDCHEP